MTTSHVTALTMRPVFTNVRTSATLPFARLASLAAFVEGALVGGTSGPAVIVFLISAAN